METRTWESLTTKERTGALLAAAVQVTLLIAALRDLRRRPAAKVRGRKGIWAAVSFVNFIGPLSYFLLGRKR